MSMTWERCVLRTHLLIAARWSYLPCCTGPAWQKALGPFRSSITTMAEITFPSAPIVVTLEIRLTPLVQIGPTAELDGTLRILSQASTLPCAMLQASSMRSRYTVGHSLPPQITAWSFATSASSPTSWIYCSLLPTLHQR